jgi:hypothetical protein
MFIIECSLIALTLILAVGLPIEKWVGEKGSIGSFYGGFRRLAARRATSVIIVGTCAVLVRLVLLPVIPIPHPAITDEFSHLLMADTFAHGRLTNPTHPMWKHFESFAIIQKPSYCSAFYPAPSSFLALGIFLGNPFWGLCLSVALMCAAICWALQAWLPPQWALLGGFLAVVRLGTFSYWANSYAGGAVAAIGGALMLGALPRMKDTQRVGYAILFALGAAILANSRPYEGLFFAAPFFAVLLLWTFRSDAIRLNRKLMRTVLPICAVLLGTIMFMGYYNWRTTNSIFNTAYLVNTKTYFVVPNFPWSHLDSAVHYNHPVMEKFYRSWPLNAYDAARAHPILIAFTKAIGLAFFFLGPLLAIPLLMLAVVLPSGFSYRDLNPKVKFLLLVCGSTFFGLLLPIYFNPHYAAPMTCAIYALVLFAMRRVSRWQVGGRPTGLALMGAIPVLCVLLLGVRAAAGPLHVPTEEGLPPSWWRVGAQNLKRARVLADLRREPGKQLVIVQYSPAHYVNDEWVYNDADIDNSKVVWARDMGNENAELVRYFHDRRTWILEPDYNPPKLTPYGQ